MPIDNIAPAVLVIGSDSFIGSALTKQLELAGTSVLGTTRRRDTPRPARQFLDLSQDVAKWQPRSPVSVVIICAGITRIEDCRRDPSATAAVNVQSVVNLAGRLASSGAFVIYLSTNQVFDGSIPHRQADDPLSAQTEYGKQKADVERQLGKFLDRVSIVRLTKVLGTNEKLLNQWLVALRQGEVIHPFRDMIMSPVPLSFVVTTLAKIIETRLPGIVQVSGEVDVTYADVAYHLARRIGASSELVQPISYAAAGLRSESAPPHTTLDTGRLRSELGLNPPSVWTTINSATGLSKGNR
jgi:dTDP-4-dehydrorhamnose reductase